MLSESTKITAKDRYKMDINQSGSYDISDFNFWYHAPYPLKCDPTEDAVQLYKAMKGLGTDDKKLISIMGNRSHEQLADIAKAYKEKYNQTLSGDIKGDTSGNYRKLLLGLLQTPQQVKTSRLIDTLGLTSVTTDEQGVIDVVCASTRTELDEIFRDAPDLKEKILNKTTGNINKILHNVIKNRQTWSLLDKERAYAIASELYKAGEGLEGTNHEKFIDLLTTYTPEFYEIVDQAYREKWGGDKGTGLKDAIDREVTRITEKNYKRALLATTSLPWEFYSDVLFQSMKGIGTEDDTIVYLFSMLDKGKLLFINSQFYYRHKVFLKDLIVSDTSFNYQKLLLTLIEETK